MVACSFHCCYRKSAFFFIDHTLTIGYNRQVLGLHGVLFQPHTEVAPNSSSSSHLVPANRKFACSPRTILLVCYNLLWVSTIRSACEADLRCGLSQTWILIAFVPSGSFASCQSLYIHLWAIFLWPWLLLNLIRNWHTGCLALQKYKWVSIIAGDGLHTCWAKNDRCETVRESQAWK